MSIKFKCYGHDLPARLVGRDGNYGENVRIIKRMIAENAEFRARRDEQLANNPIQGVLVAFNDHPDTTLDEITGILEEIGNAI